MVEIFYKNLHKYLRVLKNEASKSPMRNHLAAIIIRNQDGKIISKGRNSYGISFPDGNYNFTGGQQRNCREHCYRQTRNHIGQGVSPV